MLPVLSLTVPIIEPEVVCASIEGGSEKSEISIISTTGVTEAILPEIHSMVAVFIIPSCKAFVRQAPSAGGGSWAAAADRANKVVAQYLIKTLKPRV